jgi:hypothetical protein
MAAYRRQASTANANDEKPAEVVVTTRRYCRTVALVARAIRSEVGAEPRAVKPPPKTADPFYLTPEYRAWREVVIARAGRRCL